MFTNYFFSNLIKLTFYKKKWLKLMFLTITLINMFNLSKVLPKELTSLYRSFKYWIR